MDSGRGRASCGIAPSVALGMQRRRRRHELPWAERSAGELDRSMKGNPLRRLAPVGHLPAREESPEPTGRLRRWLNLRHLHRWGTLSVRNSALPWRRRCIPSATDDAMPQPALLLPLPTQRPSARWLHTLARVHPSTCPGRSSVSGSGRPCSRLGCRHRCPRCGADR